MKPGQLVRMAWEVEMREIVYTVKKTRNFTDPVMGNCDKKSTGNRKFTAGKYPVFSNYGAFPGSKFSGEYTVNPVKYDQPPVNLRKICKRTVNWPLIYKVYGHFPVNLRFPVLFLSQLPITGSVKLRLFFTVYLSTSALNITNTIFQQHPRRKYTWISANGLVRNQIDYILITSRWKSSIKIAKTLPDSGSDHQLLISDFRIKLKMTKSSLKPRRFDLQHLDDNYRVETKSLFQQLLITEEETTPNELWLDIKDSILRAATKHVPKKGKRNTTSWLSQEAINLADERRQVKEAGLQGSNLYRKLSSEVQLNVGEINLSTSTSYAKNLRTRVRTISAESSSDA